MHMSTNEHAVVIFDPERKEPEGEVLSGNRLAVARSRGVIELPINPSLLRSGALSGYARRAYGRGWKYDSLRAGRGCPIALYAVPEHPILNWVVRLVPDEEGARRAGHLRVGVDTAQHGAAAAGLTSIGSPLNASDLAEPDADGGWTWRGRSQVTLNSEGQLIGLMLYGALSGVRVAWWAVSQG